MSETLGDFLSERDCGEHLLLSFSKGSLPLKERWRNNSLTADFLADYAITFFPAGRGDDTRALKRQREIKDSVSYIANELLENGLKYHEGGAAHDLNIRFEIHSDRLVISQTNVTGAARAERLRHLARELLEEDIDTLFLQRLENTDETSAGLGLITILHDHGAALAWRLSPLPNALHAVTTQATLILNPEEE
ncbi:MAG: ATP-binding protein [Pseudomonadota bacterium]